MPRPYITMRTIRDVGVMARYGPTVILRFAATLESFRTDRIGYR